MWRKRMTEWNDVEEENDACVLWAEERNRGCFSVLGDCGGGQPNSFRLGDVAISTA